MQHHELTSNNTTQKEVSQRRLNSVQVRFQDTQGKSNEKIYAGGKPKGKSRKMTVKKSDWARPRGNKHFSSAEEQSLTEQTQITRKI